MRIVLCCFCWLSLSFLAEGADPPSIEIPRIARPPLLDDFQGMNPSPEVRDSMVKISGFIQREPDDGLPATHDTHVYMAYDQKHLYVVFLAFDAEPEKIRARRSPREQVFEDDFVDLQIDTFNDRRRAYTFLATPLGIQWDALWTEGQDFDSSYDALWRSEGRLTDQGYMVRMVIPFSTMRFSAKEKQTWSMIFNRTIPRLGEESFWPQYTNRIEGRLNQAAEVTGVADVSPGRNIRLNPYVFARNFRFLDRDAARYEKDSFDPDGGLDAKFVIRDSFVLDLTANPDFSQVESDEPQVTVNQRFEVQFPERRPFFLENADFFRTPINLAFTRRIREPRAGVRFTGKQGPWGLGLLLADDEAPGQGLAEGDPNRGDSAGIGILRVNRDISNQSTLGFLATQREFGDDENGVLALDGRVKLNANWVARFQAAAARTEEGGQTREGNSYDISVNRDGRHLSMHNHFLRTDPDFVTRLGFLRGEQRPNSRNLHHQSGWTFRPQNSALVSWGPSTRIGRIWDLDGEPLDTFYNPEIEFEWTGDTEAYIQYNYNRQRLTPRDFPTLPGDREFTEADWELGFESEYFSAFNFEVEFGHGQAVNFEPLADQLPEEADLQSVELEFTLRPISPLRVEGTFFWLKLEDQQGRGDIFTNTIWRVRANWQFSRELSLRLISQWEDTDPNTQLTSLERERNWNTDLLLRYVLNPWTALYLGYNDNQSNFQILDAAVLEAEARLQAARLDAEAQISLAEASARAISLVTEAVGNETVPAMYLLGERYVGAMENLASSTNAKVVVLPADLQETVRGLMGRHKA